MHSNHTEAVKGKNVGLEWTGTFRTGAPGELLLDPLIDVESEKLFGHVGLEAAAHERFRKLLQDKAAQTRPMDQLKEHYLELPQLEEWWKDLPAHFQLTSVGIAIAHANLRRRGLGGYDLRIWIN